MNRMMKAVMALAIVPALWGMSLQAQAASLNPDAHMDLVVALNCTRGVQVDGVLVSTYNLGTAALASQYLQSGSTATVTNTSGCANETWQLLASTYTPAGLPATSGWTLNNATGPSHANLQSGSLYACSGPTNVAGQGCPGVDQYSVQALFVSSSAVACPAINATNWDVTIDTIAGRAGWSYVGPVISTGASNTYFDTQYADQADTTNQSHPDDANGQAGYMRPYLNNDAGLSVGRRGRKLNTSEVGGENSR